MFVLPCVLYLLIIDYCFVFFDTDLKIFQQHPHIYTTVVQRLKEQHDIQFDVSYRHNHTCGICGRSVDRKSGFYIDIFKYSAGMGPNTRSAKYRGAVKGCWREQQNGEFNDPQFQTLASTAMPTSDWFDRQFVHQSGEWHMFGWDIVLRKQRLLPLRRVSNFEGVVDGLYVPNDPVGAANAEYGSCAKWNQGKEHFALYAVPQSVHVVGVVLMGALACLWMVVTRVTGLREMMYTPSRDMMPKHLFCASFAFFLFAVLPLSCMYLVSNYLRSGFAASSMVVLCTGIAIFCSKVMFAEDVGGVRNRNRNRDRDRWWWWYGKQIGSTLSSILLCWSLLPFYSMLNWILCMVHLEWAMLSCRKEGEDSILGI